MENSYQSNEYTRQRFLHLSRIKYNGFMDGWERSLSLDIRSCEKCGHYWHHIQPDQDALWEMYKESTPLDPTNKQSEPSTHMFIEMQRVRRLSRRSGKEKPTFLDYGSGSGLWSLAAAKSGFVVTAYEPCLSRADLIKASTGILVVNRLEELEGRIFDVINLEQVLEHTQTPVDVLISLRKYTHYLTILRISVPNMAVQARKEGLWTDFPFDGKTIHIMSPYEHLQGFFPSSLKMALAMSGLEQLHAFEIIALDPLNWVRWKVGNIVPFLAQTKVYARFRI
jgi:2-polyprenyl-3-methyl-5-hydroxy-6-metoxy-1,4-benzoquinol methylase